MRFLPCVFCRIIEGKERADIVAQTPTFLAFRPLNPVTSGHLLVIPRRHVRDAGIDPELTGATAAFAAVLAKEHMPPSYNLITSVGSAATQTIEHLCLHLVPRVHSDGLALPWDSEYEDGNP